MIAVSQYNSLFRYGIIITTNTYPFSYHSSKYVETPGLNSALMRGLHIQSTDILISVSIIVDSPNS